eukprot:EC125120.1.p2 GENE.EC125120.1~~EC125120.1.p2  ORF type:complete len:128 (+),score=21.24 EC125120.1:48-431(+)
MATPQTIDLTSRIGPYLDRHLVFPLLEFLQSKEIYPPDELLQAKLYLLSETNMVDFAMDIHKKLNDTEEVPNEFKERREKVVAQLRLLNGQVAPFECTFRGSRVGQGPPSTESFQDAVFAGTIRDCG